MRDRRPDAEKLQTSWRQEQGNAASFYAKLGFKRGVVDESGEVHAWLAI